MKYKILGFVFLVLVFAAIVSVAYYFQVANQPILAPILHNDETANWKTYSNDLYGFELKYPASWVMSDSADITIPEWPIVFSNPKDTNAETGSLGVFLSAVNAGTKCVSAEAYVHSLDNNLEHNMGIGSYDVNNLNNLDSSVDAWTVESTGGEAMGTITHSILLTPKNCRLIAGKQFFIEIRRVDQNAYYDQILPTFKFKGVRETNSGILGGHVFIGPICPVGSNGDICFPTPEMFLDHEIIVMAAQKEVARFHADNQGLYHIWLPEGTYTLKAVKSGIGYMSKDLPENVVIHRQQTTLADVNFDTGIR